MTVSPNISALINLLAGIGALIVASASQFTTLFGTGTSATIVGVGSLIVAVTTAINAVLHSTSAPNAGVLASRQT
jgi:hypothetical protein